MGSQNGEETLVLDQTQIYHTRQGVLSLEWCRVLMGVEVVEMGARGGTFE